MGREHRRHPFFETLVFGFALVLAVILLFYGARMYFRQDAAGPYRPGQTTGSAAALPVIKLTGKPAAKLDVGPTERGVNMLPPVQISTPGKTARKSGDVPLPK